MNFRIKTILGIALIETILLIILILSVLGFLNNSHEQEINQRARSTAELFAAMSKEAVLSSDLASLESFIEQLLTNQDIVYARIIADDVILAQGGKNEFLFKTFEKDVSLNNINDDVFDISADIVVSDFNFGRVELGLSISRITSVLEQARQWSIGIAVIEVTLVAIFSFILGTWLTRQLYQLKIASEVIADEGPGHKISVKGNDEVALVAKSFNFMSERLLDSYEELKKTSNAHRAIAKLASANEAFKAAVLSSSLDAIISVDSNGIIVEYNHAAEEIFGYSHGEAMGSTMSQLIIPDEFREAHRKGFQRFIETRESSIINQRLELKALHKDGSVFPIELTISVTENLNQTYLTAFVRDITEQENARQELLLASHAFETHEAIFISDANNNILRVNQSFTHITGYSASEVIGKNPRIFSSGRQTKGYYQQMYHTLNQKGFWEGEIYNKRKNGDVYPEWLGISVVKDDNGNITHYVAHFIDISKRIESEEKLRLARKAAEQANEAKSDFLATMSHEIRTPMNAILGTLDLLKDTSPNHEQQTYITTAHQSATSLLSIINDILDFSKIEANKLIIESSSFSIRKHIDSCITLLSVKAKEMGNILKVHIDDDIPDRLISDPGRIKQILINLTNNAIKFTQNGSVTISIRTIESTNGQIQLSFEIIDTGIGIGKSSQENLFTPFYQVEQHSSRSYEGTGLGLAICSKLIHLLGGEIGVDSEVGNGSRFWFNLTLDIDNSEHVKKGIEYTNKPVGLEHGLNVLLVEDSQANIVVARAILEKSGCQISVAENGLEAIEAIEATTRSLDNHYYDIILMDLMMPKMDGIEATKVIRNMSDPVSTIPIIAMTANAIKGYKEQCLEAGMDDYISKPYDAQEMLRKIAEYTQSELKYQTSDIVVQAADEDYPILSEDILKQLAKDTSDELVPEMITVFIKELKKRLNHLQQATEHKQLDIIATEAHTLKSSSGTYGALKLQALAIEIDTACKVSEHEKALHLSKSIIELIQNTIDKYSQRFSL